ncbi:hypothetical protein BS47DRAFT_1403449 [Hydnum rufescens UP504]|uniref:Uncharacterized protein n=1 Tax=Hydnum rufescens UP504 TaxID=1448309 RepID=A0A9P6AAD8_9AGAM|nr:hypothetical protein BS47DRAFT_1403449 [Hydnum rufescens UP504]
MGQTFAAPLFPRSRAEKKNRNKKAPHTTEHSQIITDAVICEDVNEPPFSEQPEDDSDISLADVIQHMSTGNIRTALLGEDGGLVAGATIVEDINNEEPFLLSDPVPPAPPLVVSVTSTPGKRVRKACDGGYDHVVQSVYIFFSLLYTFPPKYKLMDYWHSRALKLSMRAALFPGPSPSVTTPREASSRPRVTRDSVTELLVEIGQYENNFTSMLQS